MVLHSENAQKKMLSTLVTRISRRTQRFNFTALADAQTAALADKNKFWGDIARESIPWFVPPKNRVLDDSSAPLFRWFPGTELNTAFVCLDHHVQSGRGNQIALIHHDSYNRTTNKVTFSNLLARVEKFSGALASAGVGKGDRVIIYMPMVPEAVVAMLACARLGAVHSVVFGGFAANELAARIRHAKPAAIVSASYGREPGKVIPYKPLLDGALDLLASNAAAAAAAPDAFAQRRTPEQGAWRAEEVPCFILRRPPPHEGAAVPCEMKAGRDVDFLRAEAEARPHAAVPVRGTDPLYVLYTSGTTGAPKGVVRDNGGHAVALKWSMGNIFGAEVRIEDFF